MCLILSITFVARECYMPCVVIEESDIFIFCVCSLLLEHNNCQNTAPMPIQRMNALQTLLQYHVHPYWGPWVALQDSIAMVCQLSQLTVSFVCDEIILKFSFLTSSYHVYLYICSTTIQATCNAHPNLPNTMPNTVNNKLCRRQIPRPQVRLPLVPKQLSLQDPWVHYNPNYGVPAPTNT